MTQQYSAQQIAMVCYEADRALHLAQTAPGFIPEPWAHVDAATHALWVGLVRSLQNGHDPLLHDETSAAIVAALSPATATGAQIADTARETIDRTAMANGGVSWLAKHAPWLLAEGGELPAELERLVVALGIWLDEHGDHAAERARWPANATGLIADDGRGRRYLRVGRSTHLNLDTARRAGFVPATVSEVTPEYVQADGFVVRGLFTRGHAQRFDITELRGTVAAWLEAHGVTMIAAEHPEAFCIANSPETDLDAARVRANLEDQLSRPAAAPDEPVGRGMMLGVAMSEDLEPVVHASNPGLTGALCEQPIGTGTVGWPYNCTACIVANEDGERIRERVCGERFPGALFDWYAAEVTRQIRAGQLTHDQISNSTAAAVRTLLDRRLMDTAPAHTSQTAAGERRPQIGDRVHYVSYGTPGGEYGRECRAAIVTEIRSDNFAVGLCVLNPTGQFFNRDVEDDEGAPAFGKETVLCTGLAHEGGTWHWCGGLV